MDCLEMESEEQNSKKTVKYYFQVIIENEEEEDSLCMDSWIYVDLEDDEELPYAKEDQSVDEDMIVTERLDDFNLIHTESNRMDISELSMDIYTAEDENISETPDSGFVQSPDTISNSLPSMTVDDNIDFDETNTHSSSSEEKDIVETPHDDMVRSLDTISNLLPSMTVNDNIDFDGTNTHSSDVYCSDVKKELPNIYASIKFLHEAVKSTTNSSETGKDSACSVKAKNTIETHSHVNKSSLFKGVQFNKDPLAKIESKDPFVKIESKDPFVKIERNCHSKKETIPIFVDDEPLIVISDDEAPVIVSDDEAPAKNTIETHSHVNKSSSFKGVQFNKDPLAKIESKDPFVKIESKDPFVKIERNCHSKKETIPIFVDDEPLIVISDDEAPVIVSDDEAPVIVSDDEATPRIISDDEHANTSDIVYVGYRAHSKDKEHPLDKKFKYDHPKREGNAHAIDTNYDCNSGWISTRNTVPPRTSHIQRKAVKHPSSSHTSDVILEKILRPLSNPKVINLEWSNPENHKHQRKRKHKSEISVTDIDRTKKYFSSISEKI